MIVFTPPWTKYGELQRTRWELIASREVGTARPARGETRAIIKYLIRRRIAGATFRAQANHLLNRTALFFGANGPAEDGDAPRPGFRHRADEDRGYDTFDDAYTRFAGRGAWSRGFDPEQL